VVLDDAVVDHRQPAVAVEVGMGVRAGDAAVGRPPGVAEADVGGGEGDAGAADLAGALLDPDAAVDADGAAVATSLPHAQGARFPARCLAWHSRMN
jgi:hypothetical protein